MFDKNGWNYLRSSSDKFFVQFVLIGWNIYAGPPNWLELFLQCILIG